MQSCTAGSGGAGLAVGLALDSRDVAIATDDERFLLPELEASEDGSGPVIETEPKQVTLTLGVTSTVENEELDVFVWGSPDGEDWGKNPIAKFRRQATCGFSRLRLDLAKTLPGVRHLRVQWRMNRWGRDRNRAPQFGFFVAMA